MNQGYPTEGIIDALLLATGNELGAENNANHYLDLKQELYNILKTVEPFLTLRVFAATATTFKVVGGDYVWQGQTKTLLAPAAVDPTDNDTTYVWLDLATNLTGSAIDSVGWPGGDIIRLAELTVDSSGNITAIKDLRGQSFFVARAIHEAQIVCYEGQVVTYENEVVTI